MVCHGVDMVCHGVDMEYPILNELTGKKYQKFLYRVDMVCHGVDMV